MIWENQVWYSRSFTKLHHNNTALASLILPQCGASKTTSSLAPAQKTPHGIRKSHPYIPLGRKPVVKILQGPHAHQWQLCSSCTSQLDPHLHWCNAIKTLIGLCTCTRLALNKILMTHKQKIFSSAMTLESSENRKLLFRVFQKLKLE